MKLRLLLYLLVLLAAFSSSAAGVDRNTNGMSDIWGIFYGAAALSPNGDADSDGVSNLAESLAGTNPFDAASVPRLQVHFLFPSTAQLTWTSFPGKRYTIQSRTNLTDPWSNESPIIASGALLQTNFSVTTTRFFRLAIDDVDSDGDGVPDYDELLLRFNPNTQRRRE